ncbi:DUF4259 domain-containing protein [Marinobacter salexigens]|uniref:DUF4259 domain-containing protein n=1 Tax=Marinobacter salexigens TaxID=1925763 RepID=A0ABS6A490_9GAMM|nr:DUF4259 domain-containing protein [Marinobacter salexigens]MBU2872985.1 DUF4259 domain-containing protein [Marinobacter salexigens]
MGAWGIGNFENDDAVDWTHDISGSKGVKVLLSPLKDVVNETGYLESPYCCQALVSAEIINKALSKDRSELPEEIQNWLERKKGLFGKLPVLEPVHASLAAQAVKKIMGDSELKELWQETGEYDQWLSEQQRLLVALERFNQSL